MNRRGRVATGSSGRCPKHRTAHHGRTNHHPPGASTGKARTVCQPGRRGRGGGVSRSQRRGGEAPAVIRGGRFEGGRLVVRGTASEWGQQESAGRSVSDARAMRTVQQKTTVLKGEPKIFPQRNFPPRIPSWTTGSDVRRRVGERGESVGGTG